MDKAKKDRIALLYRRIGELQDLRKKLLEGQSFFEQRIVHINTNIKAYQSELNELTVQTREVH